MKKIILIVLIQFIIYSFTSAQKIDKEVGTLSKIEIYGFCGKIEIIGTDNNRVIIEPVKINEVSNGNAVDFDFKKKNTILDINLKERISSISIYPTSLVSQYADYRISVPKTFKIKIINELFTAGAPISNTGEDPNETNINYSFNANGVGNKVFVKSILSEVEVELFAGDFNASNVSGPIVANVFSGNVNIEFSEFNQNFPSSINAFSGNINVSLPELTKCDVKLRSSFGSVDSEFDLSNVKINHKPLSVEVKTLKGGKSINKQKNDANKPEINGKINKGGAELNLGSFSGDIKLTKL